MVNQELIWHLEFEINFHKVELSFSAAFVAMVADDKVVHKRKLIDTDIIHTYTLISQMIKGCKEKFFINQIFDENIRRLHQGKKFFGKKNACRKKMLAEKMLCRKTFFPDEDV